jgi:uncharacterized repeat protein (TIGR01451 family)
VVQIYGTVSLRGGDADGLPGAEGGTGALCVLSTTLVTNSSLEAIVVQTSGMSQEEWLVYGGGGGAGGGGTGGNGLVRVINVLSNVPDWNQPILLDANLPDTGPVTNVLSPSNAIPWGWCVPTATANIMGHYRDRVPGLRVADAFVFPRSAINPVADWRDDALDNVTPAPNPRQDLGWYYNTDGLGDPSLPSPVPLPGTLLGNVLPGLTNYLRARGVPMNLTNFSRALHRKDPARVFDTSGRPIPRLVPESYQRLKAEIDANRPVLLHVGYWALANPVSVRGSAVPGLPDYDFASWGAVVSTGPAGEVYDLTELDLGHTVTAVGYWDGSQSANPFHGLGDGGTTPDAVIVYDNTDGTLGGPTRSLPLVLPYSTNQTNSGLNVPWIMQTEMVIPPLWDFGDAPDPPYPTLRSSDGARHVLRAGWYLGARVDGETNGQPSAAANGDDLVAVPSDEDGVFFYSPLVVTMPVTVIVFASTNGYLSGWIDFNADGDWADPGEQIFSDASLGPGVNMLSFTMPEVVTFGNTYARFRFSSTNGLSYLGEAPDGEVEDCQVALSDGLEYPVADLGIMMVGQPDPVGLDGNFTYTLWVTNQGPQASTATGLTDPLPAGVSFVSANASQGRCSNVTGTVTCLLGSLGVGASATVQITVSPNILGSVTNVAMATTSETDPNPTDNTATVVTSVRRYPPGGWSYTYEGIGVQGGACKPATALDGSWSSANFSSEWDGLGRGPGTGAAGGISSTNSILTIEDIDSLTGTCNNRKIYFTRDLALDSATTNAEHILDNGVTIAFRARLTHQSVQPPPDNPGLPDGWGIFSDGKGHFNVHQSSVAGGVTNHSIIGFSLVRVSEPDNGFNFAAAGLTMNRVNGNAPSGGNAVDSTSSAVLNPLLPLDPSVFHDFWIILRTNRYAGSNGTHTVDIYVDDSPTPTTFNVTAGTGFEGHFNYLGMGLNNSRGSGALDVDYFSYKQGTLPPVLLPPTLAIELTPTNTVVVSWPALAKGWRLHATTNLVTGGSAWTEIPPPYQTNGLTNTSFTEPAPLGNKFYRLHKP